ncbi:MAG: TPM domain-containing protein [Chitinophagaceae bacterium]|nr:TPM domain-containing protein [Chitinophagaceae bacterium]
MKKFLLLFFVFASLMVGAQTIQPRPVPPQAVNDFGHMLEPFQVQSLEQKVRAYNDSTSSAIVIITVPDLQGYDISEVSLKYLRDWGVGTKEKNNGVVILVSKAERRARIETGYGMEGVLPDAVSKDIIEERMLPAFKDSDYYRGFDNAVDAVIQAAAGEYKAAPQNHVTGVGGIPVRTIFFLIVIVIFILSRIGGGGGGSYMSRKGSTGLGGLPWFLLGNMLGGGSRGGWSGGSGGGFGGGGFGGGGFGGFGGGSGGGGGASGGW